MHYLVKARELGNPPSVLFDSPCSVF